ncbi:MAG: amidohydrolase [Defluviitaleaceae bacterium]|nr:amidohydrolase [Defluviitaleaceae bacterium]
MKEKIIELAKQMQPELAAFRRDFHKHPELAWTEFRTTAIIATELEKAGFEILIGEEAICGNYMKNVPADEVLAACTKRAISQGADPRFVDAMAGGKTALVGVLDTKKPGPVVALRFDTDALPITESSHPDHPPVKAGYVSINPGIMHSCAHDGHAAIGIGMAMILSQLKNELTGVIKLIFQPAEEGVQGGAVGIIKKGIVDDADFMLSFHMGLHSAESTIYCETNDFKATTKYDINFHGKSAHAGANPEDGKSALIAAAAATLALNSIPRHSKGASRIHIGVLNSGTASNIVPDHAYLEIETRGETTEINEFMKANLYRILDGIAKAYDIQVNLDPAIVETGEAISATCDPCLVSLTRATAKDLGIFEHIKPLAGLGGSEDYTFFMEHVQKKGGKATHFILPTKLSAKHHHPNFDIDDSMLWKGVAQLTLMTVKSQNLLTQP